MEGRGTTGSLVPHSGKPNPWTRGRGFSDLLFQLLPSISLHSTPPPHTPISISFSCFLPTFLFLAPLGSPGAGRWHEDSFQQKQVLEAGPASGPQCLLGTHSWKRGHSTPKTCPSPLHLSIRVQLDLPFPGSLQTPPGGQALPTPTPHPAAAVPLPPPCSNLGSWARREMEAKRLAVAAAGQGAVGLRSRGGRRGCPKRLARKASGWEQEKRASEERTEAEGGGLGKA